MADHVLIVVVFNVRREANAAGRNVDDHRGILPLLLLTSIPETRGGSVLLRAATIRFLDTESNHS